MKTHTYTEKLLLSESYLKEQKKYSHGKQVSIQKQIENEKAKTGLYLEQPFRKRETTQINFRYLPGIELSHRNIFHKSYFGTGKTYGIKELIEKNPCKKFVIVTHRLALIEDLSTRLGVKSFTEYREEYAGREYFHELKKHDGNIIITPNSLHLLNAGNYKDCIFIVDENHSVLESITGETCKEQRKIILESFECFLNISKNNLLFDANLNDIDVDIIQEITSCKDSEIKIVVNNHRPERRNLFLTPDKMTFEDTLKSKNNPMVGYYSKEDAKKEFSKNSKNTLLITRDTNKPDNEPVKKFLSNPSEESKNYDRVLMTPVCFTGVSIENENFDSVFMSATDNKKTVSPIESTQFPHRYRDFKTDFYLNITENETSYEESWVAILSNLYQDDSDDRQLRSYNKAGKLEVEKRFEWYYELKSKLQAETNKQRNNLEDYLLSYFIDCNCRIIRMKSTFDNKRAVKEKAVEKFDTLYNRINKAKRIVTSKSYNQNQIDFIIEESEKRKLSSKEESILEMANWKNLVGLDNIPDVILKFNDDYSMVKNKITMFRFVNQSDLLNYKEMDSEKSKNSLPGEIDKRALKASLIREIIDILPESYDKGTIEDFIKFCLTNKHRIKRILNIDVSIYLTPEIGKEIDPIRLISNIFDKIGLKLSGTTTRTEINLSLLSLKEVKILYCNKLEKKKSRFRKLSSFKRFLPECYEGKKITLSLIKDFRKFYSANYRRAFLLLREKVINTKLTLRELKEKYKTVYRLDSDSFSLMNEICGTQNINYKLFKLNPTHSDYVNEFSPENTSEYYRILKKMLNDKLFESNKHLTHYINECSPYRILKTLIKKYS